MTSRRSVRVVVAGFCACAISLGACFVAGCNQDTIEPSPDRAGQLESAQKGVDLSAKSKSGKKTGPPIVVKSVKGLIKKDAQE
jgi:hypothetical protein